MSEPIEVRYDRGGIVLGSQIINSNTMRDCVLLILQGHDFKGRSR